MAFWCFRQRYHIDSKDKQIDVGPIGMQVIRNVGEAWSQGIEVEAMLRPTDRLTLTANAAFGRSGFTDFVDPLSGVSYTGNGAVSLCGYADRGAPCFSRRS